MYWFHARAQAVSFSIRSLWSETKNAEKKKELTQNSFGKRPFCKTAVCFTVFWRIVSRNGPAPFLSSHFLSLHFGFPIWQVWYMVRGLLKISEQTQAGLWLPWPQAGTMDARTLSLGAWAWHPLCDVLCAYPLTQNYYLWKTILKCLLFRAGFRQNGFFADFFFWAAGFFRGFLAGFFILIFVGISAQKNPPGKSPGKSSKIYTTKVLQHISADSPGQYFWKFYEFHA